MSVDTLRTIHDTLSLALANDTLKVYSIPANSIGFKWAEYLKPSIDY